MKFEMECVLDKDEAQLSKELLTLAGVNYELGPWLRMSAPKEWYERPLYLWPEKQDIFTSTIYFLGLLPIDLHRFGFISVDPKGFKESSSSLLNRTWAHTRTIEQFQNGTKVNDSVEYEPKFKPLGYVLKPIYKLTFAHRHKRLKLKYT